jgi:microcystin-dependent protein
MRKVIIAFLLLVSSSSLSAQDAYAYTGEIRMFAGNFAPSNWAFCNGQLLTISQNAALFSIIGTTYGGNGQTNFALPDLRGRVPVQFGQGSGLSNYSLGETGGQESVTLTTSNLPAHTHGVTISPPVKSDGGTSDDPSGKYPASPGVNAYSSTSNTTGADITATTSATGSGSPVNIRQPYLCINFIICTNGIFPPRP